MKAHLSKIVGEGLTYDDVLLVPAFSEVLPREVNISTQFTRNLRINVPIVSAAMDTVTESKMAIAMANAGGIGVIHRNLDIRKQAKEAVILPRITVLETKNSNQVTKSLNARKLEEEGEAKNTLTF